MAKSQNKLLRGHDINNLPIAAIYVAKREFLTTLCDELGDVSHTIEDLVFSVHKNETICFAQDIWLEPHIVRFQSISEAVKILRAAGKFWYLHPVCQVRRSTLIEEQLRTYASLMRDFPVDTDIPPIGVFCLLDQHTLVYSAKRLKKWPQGKCYFIEDKINPPNRAYLKLWEAFTFVGRHPKAGERALDLGASPGGWTYVLQSLGARVTAVDKALLDPKITKLPNVHFLQQSAFALDPNTLEEPFDWVVSDIACYPERAYTLIMQWISSGKALNMIFTIKFQGDIAIETLQRFQSIPNARLCNLFYNKHEATFFYPTDPSMN